MASGQFILYDLTFTQYTFRCTYHLLQLPQQSQDYPGTFCLVCTSCTITFPSTPQIRKQAERYACSSLPTQISCTTSLVLLKNSFSCSFAETANHDWRYRSTRCRRRRRLTFNARLLHCQSEPLLSHRQLPFGERVSQCLSLPRLPGDDKPAGCSLRSSKLPSYSKPSPYRRLPALACSLVTEAAVAKKKGTQTRPSLCDILDYSRQVAAEGADV